MQLRTLGNTGIQVTPVGMGVMAVGRTQLDLPIPEGAAIVRYALESGINFLDTAQWYKTYPYIKEALKGGGFEPVIASKSLAYSYDEMKASVDEMRLALDIDVIDIFLLHEVRTGTDFEEKAPAWACLNDLKAKGVVKAIGISTHYVDVSEMNATLPESDILFPLINKDSLGVRYLDGPGTKEAMAAAIKANRDAGKGVFAMKVFGGGNLTGNYLESLDYVYNLYGIDSMMVGISATHEIDRLVEYAEGRIDRSYQPDISGKKIRIDSGDCEGCGACIDICPNKAIDFNDDEVAEVDHGVCLTCGYCAPACPVRAIIMY